MNSAANPTTRVPAADAARFIGRKGWLLALLGVPLSLAVGAYGVLLVVVMLTLMWQAAATILSRVAAAHQGKPKQRVAVQPTRWGWIYAGMALLFAVLAALWGSNPVYLAAAFLLAGVVCSAVLPRLALADIGVAAQLPERVHAGEDFKLSLTVTNRSRWLSALGLRIETQRGRDRSPRLLGSLAPGQATTVLARRAMPRRGLHAPDPVQLRTGFPFGLCEARLKGPQMGSILVYPRLGILDPQALLRHTAGEARWASRIFRRDPHGEFHALREYQHGDNPRHIHWPTSARLGQLHVRQFERREQPSVLLLLDAFCGGQNLNDDLERQYRFEDTVRFTATLAVYLTTEAVPFSFASCCPEPTVVSFGTGSRHLNAVLEALALAEMNPNGTARDLTGALTRRDMRRGGTCLVTPGPLSDAQLLRSLPGEPLAIDANSESFHDYFTG